MTILAQGKPHFLIQQNNLGADLSALNFNDVLAPVAKVIKCHNLRTACSSPSLRAWTGQRSPCPQSCQMAKLQKSSGWRNNHLKYEKGVSGGYSSCLQVRDKPWISHRIICTLKDEQQFRLARSISISKCMALDCKLHTVVMGDSNLGPSCCHCAARVGPVVV